ncbi:unnamed protein product [Urochloa humidicola]
MNGQAGRQRRIMAYWFLRSSRMAHNPSLVSPDEKSKIMAEGRQERMLFQSQAHGGFSRFAVAFVMAFSHDVGLVSLLCCLLLLERTPPGSATTERVKLVVWFMAGATVVGGSLLWFTFLAFNSCVTIFRFKGDTAAVGLAASSNVVLVVLFCCFRWFERKEPRSTTRSKLKVIMWLLTLLFSYKVAATTRLRVQILVWGMAVAVVLGGLYACFLHTKRKDDTVDATFSNERLRRRFVLAAMRWSRSPQTAGAIREDQRVRDAAWSVTRLIVDSGATSHAVGNVCLLEDFQAYRSPLVATLADGSSRRILGVGRIQRGSFSIPNVSLVEGLQDGLISTPQLDRHHRLISCFGNGVCRIMEADGTVVGGAFLEEGNTYVLSFLAVPAQA